LHELNEVAAPSWLPDLAVDLSPVWAHFWPAGFVPEPGRCSLIGDANVAPVGGSAAGPGACEDAAETLGSDDVTPCWWRCCCRGGGELLLAAGPIDLESPHWSWRCKAAVCSVVTWGRTLSAGGGDDDQGVIVVKFAFAVAWFWSSKIGDDASSASSSSGRSRPEGEQPRRRPWRMI
jgi:hypothetical protein